jgi:hypothetical protein
MIEKIMAAEYAAVSLVVLNDDDTPKEGRSFLEAPNWLSDRIRLAAERWAESGGKSTDPDEAAEDGDAAAEVRWLDRAAAAVESRLGRVEQGYLASLMQAFERRWRDAQSGKKVEPEEPRFPDPNRGHGS